MIGRISELMVHPEKMEQFFIGLPVLLECRMLFLGMFPIVKTV